MRSIFITTQFNATHSWPECHIDEVKFLQHEHRHTFKVKVELEVLGNDRELEFFVLKGFVDGIIEKEYGPGLKRLGRTSCEMICENIIKAITASHFYTPIATIYDITGTIPLDARQRRIVVEVSEDGEVGARVENM